MRTIDFKKYLKENKTSLIGVTTTVIFNEVEKNFDTLKDLGNYLLEILTADSQCEVIFEDTFYITNKSQDITTPKQTEAEYNKGVYETLKKWGTTV